MGRRRIVIPIGTRNGHLTVIRNDIHLPTGHWGVELECDCGCSVIMANGVFRSRKNGAKREYCSRSCGFRWKSNDKGIGLGSGFPGWYKSYNAMKGRCYIPSARGYENYGGRGITVCARWLENPMNFYEDMGERPEGMTIDRIEVDGNYEPGNCRWATASEQAQNKRKK